MSKFSDFKLGRVCGSHYKFINGSNLLQLLALFVYSVSPGSHRVVCMITMLLNCKITFFAGISSSASGLLRLFQRITQPSPTVTDNLLVQIIIAISAGIAACTTITGFYLFCYDSTTANARRKKRPSYYNPLMVIPLVTVVTILAALSLNHFHPIERIESGAVTLVLVLAMTITILLASRIELFGDSVMFRRLVWKAVTWLFILSIPWEFFRLYRHQVAEQFTHVMKVCRLGMLSIWELKKD